MEMPTPCEGQSQFPLISFFHRKASVTFVLTKFASYMSSMVTNYKIKYT